MQGNLCENSTCHRIGRKFGVSEIRENGQVEGYDLIIHWPSTLCVCEIKIIVPVVVDKNSVDPTPNGFVGPRVVGA